MAPKSEHKHSKKENSTVTCVCVKFPKGHAIPSLVLIVIFLSLQLPVILSSYVCIGCVKCSLFSHSLLTITSELHPVPTCSNHNFISNSLWNISFCMHVCTCECRLILSKRREWLSSLISRYCPTYPVSSSTHFNCNSQTKKKVS